MKNASSRKLAERLRALRKDRSQTEFAKLCGLSQQVYWRYEQGTIPRTDVLVRMATRNGVTPEWLLGINDDDDSGPLRLPIPDGMVQRILARQQSGNGTGTSPEMTVADAVAYIARQLDLDPNRVMETIIDLVKQRPVKSPTAPSVAKSEAP